MCSVLVDLGTYTIGSVGGWVMYDVRLHVDDDEDEDEDDGRGVDSYSYYGSMVKRF
jgi:hypothetical protein